MKKLSFLQNTIVLVVSNLITGSLMFLFSIILSKEVGAQGVGLYQMIMPVYSLFICFTCGGTTTALSKIVAEQNSKKNTSELYKSISASIAFFSLWTAVICIVIILAAPFISLSVLKDVRTYQSILIFIPALICVSIGSILKGYFYGLQNSTFPAVIDIVEKTVRVIVLIILVTSFKNYGLKYQVAGAVGAMTAGELISCALLYISYKRSRYSVKQITGTPDNVFQIIVNVLKISLPLCLNGFLATMLGTFITVMIPRRLQSAGLSAESALALFGKLSGMGLSVVMFPSIIIGAISIILVPVISEASSTKNMLNVNRKIYSTIKITTTVAALSAGLFFSLPGDLGRLFYQRGDLGGIIFSLSFGVIFIYVESTLFGILNGLGKQGILLRNTIIMSAVDITLLYILLGIPEINIYGYAVNFVVSPLVGCILNTIEIKKITDIQINIGEILLLPLAATVGQVIVLKSLIPVAHQIFSTPALTTSILILIGAAVYGLIYFLLGSFPGKKS